MRLTEQALRDAVLSDALRTLAAEVLHDGDPALLWVRWVNDNLADIPLGAFQLGVEVEDGPDYVQRLKAAVLAELIIASKHNG